MSGKQQAVIRATLLAHPDGLTGRQVAELTGGPSDYRLRSVAMSLRRMPDVYIDRWQLSAGPPAPVFVAVVVPEDCPKPEKRNARS